MRRDATSVCSLHALDLERITVNLAGDSDFLADVPFDLRSIVDFQHLVIHDEDGSRTALYALRGAVLVPRASAFGPALRVGDPVSKLIGHCGNRKQREHENRGCNQFLQSAPPYW